MLGVNPNAIRQEDDFYATDPKALEIFLDKLKQDNIILNHYIWEPACGNGHLSKVLVGRGYSVCSSDKVVRQFDCDEIDFLKLDTVDNAYEGDILTNPPFKLAEKFVEQGYRILSPGNKLLLFLKIQFLEGQKRKELFKKFPPKFVYVYSARQLCVKDGEFEKYTATTQCYAWYIWEKGYKGETIIRWI